MHVALNLPSAAYSKSVSVESVNKFQKSYIYPKKNLTHNQGLNFSTSVFEIPNLIL
jgi:hypothetical protein